MRRLRRHDVIPALALTAVLTLLSACAEDQPVPSVPRAEGPQPEQEFMEYRLVETVQGVRQWILESDKMQKFAEQEDVQLVTVKMDFFQDGEHFSVLTSDSGRANLQTKDLHTWGDVVVITDDGRRLEAAELFFDNETQLITNEVFNRFTRGRDVTTGIGLVATADLESVEIQEDVQFDVTDEVLDEEGGT